MTNFPALQAARNELQALFDEAGPSMNLGNIKSLGNVSSAEKAAKIRELNDRVEELKGVQRQAESGYKLSGDGNTSADLKPHTSALRGEQTLTKGQSVTRWLSANGHIDESQASLNFGRYLKGMVTGEWEGAEAEKKAMSEGALGAGGHLVPTPLSGSIVDLARNQSRVFQSGATMVPMTAATLKIPRLTGEGAPAWRNENAVITPGDLTFDAVTFTAHSMARLVVMSRELFEDSDPSAGGVIASSFAAQIGLELDRVALRGSGTAPEPRGVLNTPGVGITAHGANGTAITNYDWWLDAAGKVREANHEPNMHLQAPRTSTSLSKLKEANTLAYLRPPADLLPMASTRQIPTDLTVGTSTSASEVYTGAWSMLGIGIRTGFQLEFLQERYADNGQVAFIAHLRADVQCFQPAAFNVDQGVLA